MVCASFNQTGRDVIGSCCTIGINGFKQPLDFCYRHRAECSKRTGLCGTKNSYMYIVYYVKIHLIAGKYPILSDFMQIL